jgi:hypothetical protein
MKKANRLYLSSLTLITFGLIASTAQASTYALATDAVRARHDAGSTYALATDAVRARHDTGSAYGLAAGLAVRARHDTGAQADQTNENARQDRSSNQELLDLNEGF